jgi:hypothetical protein
MNKDYIYEWKSIESMPLFWATIDVLFQEIEQQYKIFLCINKNGYQLNSEHLTNIVHYYTNLIDKLMLYETQLNKWKEYQPLNEKQNDAIELLLDKLLKSNKLTQSILELAMSFQYRSENDKHFDFIE